MSNIEQALKAALAAIDLYDYTMTVEESEKFAKSERLCKSALAEIGKCEPVAYEIRGDKPDSKNRELVYAEAIHKYHMIDASRIVREFYTSPISKEWVGLTENDILDAWRTAKGGGFQDYAESLEAKLKQLNSEKG